MYELETLINDLIRIEASGARQWRKAYRAHPAISLKIYFRNPPITNIRPHLQLTYIALITLLYQYIYQHAKKTSW